MYSESDLYRLKKVLGRSSLEDILQGYTVNGGNVRHNCIFLNKSGIVTNIAPEDHLPHWVLSAMKCLARWPEKVEGDLPSYPGFEKDVFGVVRDYFLGHPEPLISHDLYDVVTNVYVQACNQLPRHSSPYAHGGRDRTRLGNSLWSATSLENVILNLTRKYCMTDSRNDLCGLTDSRPDLFHTMDTRSEWSRSNADLAHMTNSGMDVRGMTFSESEFCHASKSHSNLYSMDAHREQSHPDVFRMVESCGDLRLHGGQSVGDLHVVPERLGVSSVSAFPSSLSRSSGLGLSDLEGRKRFSSTPELQVAHYETAFGPENQTVTRVYYCNGVATDYQHGTSQESESFAPVETHFDVEPDTSKPQYSAGHISFERVSNKSGNLSASCEHSRSAIERSRSLSRLAPETSKVSNTSSGGQEPAEGAEDHQQNENVSPVWLTLPRSTMQRRNRAERYNTLGGAEFVFGVDAENRKLEDVGRHLSASTPYLPSADEPDGPDLRHRGATATTSKSSSASASSKRSASLFMNFPQSGLCEERATRALQVVFLFLPPASRRKLHFLLKLLSKMAANPFLTLDPSQSTRSLVLGTFQRAVLQSGENAELDEVLVLQLMSFLMDHHMDILAVPIDMKEAVEDRLKALEKPQIVYTPRDTETLRFCQPMSVQQYEATTQDHSHKALADLLDNIVRDQNMREKDRHRRLKQFQKTYPQIYKKRFPSADSDPLQRDARPPIKPPLLAKPLMKLRGLRV
nr:hypothetical protein BaRGS_023515 [Batillaria attramentaria]